MDLFFFRPVARAQHLADGRQRKSAFPGITGDNTSIDTEPVVSPDGAKLAYTSRSLDALPTTPSYIWTASADGSLTTMTRPGHSAAWAPDGNRIAYVSPENKIWV